MGTQLLGVVGPPELLNQMCKSQNYILLMTKCVIVEQCVPMIIVKKKLHLCVARCFLLVKKLGRWKNLGFCYSNYIHRQKKILHS